MRSLCRALVLGLAALIAAPAAAQDEPSLPKGPVPYTQIRPKRPPPKTPTAPPASSAAARAPGAAPAAVVAGAPSSATAARTTGSARFAPAQPIPPAELEAWADGWIGDAMERAHVAGVTVSVVQNGQVILKKGYGFADAKTRRPVDPDRSLFRIASISKTFTWILLMKQVEAGRIRLDQPVNSYLPARVRVRDDGQSRPILVRHLLDHSAGFEDRALGQLFEPSADRVRPSDLYLRQERPRRVREPGVLSSYSNYGAALAGQAVVKVSGKTFERLAEEEITGPLGMRHTTFREPRTVRRGLPLPMSESLSGDVATGYLWTGTGYRPRPFEYAGQIAPAGAGSSTAADMTRYMLMLLGDGTWNGVTVFGPRAARAFRTPLQATPDGMNGWVHGFIASTLPGGFRGYGHDGATIAFRSQMTVIPELGLGVFIGTNTDSGGLISGQFADRLVRQFYAVPVAFPRAGSPELSERAAAFEGYYLSTRRTYGGLEGFVTRSISGEQVNVTRDGRLVIRDGDGAQTYVPDDLDEGRFIGAQSDSRVFFRLGPDGRATSFRTASNSRVFERAPFWAQPRPMIIMAGLTGFAAAVTLVALATRNRRELRQNPMQARAALVQTMQAGLWLAALALMAAFGQQAEDRATVMFGWPSPLVVTASTCALVATVLTVLTILALPAVWQGGRRVESWPFLRKAFFTVTVLIYAGFAVLIAMWGGLLPWNA